MIVLDIETTGKDPRKNSIIALGAMELSNPRNGFYGQCTPWSNIGAVAEVNPEFIAARKISVRDIHSADRMSFENLIGRYLFWTKSVEDKIPAGYNITTTVSFLREAIRRATLSESFAEKIIPTNTLDIYTLAYSKLRSLAMTIPNPLGLEQIIQFVGIEHKNMLENIRDKVMLEAEALSRLMDGKALLGKYKHPNSQVPVYLLPPEHR